MQKLQVMSSRLDHETLANALAEVLGESVDAKHLPINNLNGQLITTIEMTLNPLTVNFTAFGKRWEFTSTSQALLKKSNSPNQLLGFS